MSAPLSACTHITKSAALLAPSSRLELQLLHDFDEAVCVSGCPSVLGCMSLLLTLLNAQLLTVGLTSQLGRQATNATSSMAYHYLQLEGMLP